MRQHAVEPMLGRRVVIDVAIDARMDSYGAVALQAGVEVAATLAEMIIGGVAEREHGKLDAAQVKVIAIALPTTFQNDAASSGGSPSP